MAERSELDELLVALRDARPEIEHDNGAAEAIRERVITQRHTPNRRRVRWSLGAAAIVAVALVIALVVTRVPAAPSIDIALVAAKSQEALGGTGRAVVAFVVDRGLESEQRGSTSVTFAADDLEMVMDFDGSRGGPGFQARNRTVDGEFYLFDGPRGDKHWIHDTNASGTRSSDMFNLDPRTLLRLLDDDADFEVVSSENGVRHLRATTVNDLPPLNFGEGPSGARAEDVKRLELWVGSDDVVRRIDIGLENTETHRSGGLTRVTRNHDGTYSKEIDPAHPGEEVTTTHRASYSVRFFDLGSPITIEAPANAARVAGQG